MDTQEKKARDLEPGDCLLGYGRVKKKVTNESEGFVHVCTPIRCLVFDVDETVDLVIR